MAPRQKGKKKTARNSDGGNEEEIDPKRQCTISTRATTSTTTSVSVKKEEEEEEVEEVEVEEAGGSNNPSVPDSVSSATEPRNAATATGTTNSNEIDNNELPTPVELSKKLCRIVDPDHYSRVEACCALDTLFKWSGTEDSEYLKYFHVYGGIVKVVDFLKAIMINSNCVGTVRMECIEKAADVISEVCSYSGDNGNTSEIVTKLITSAMDYDVIGTLINVSEEYSGGDDVPRLEALDSVWTAFRNITSHINENGNKLSQDQAIVLFDTGIDIFSYLKSNNGLMVSSILENIFVTLGQIIDKSYMDKKHFQNKNILSKCLDVFRKEDGTWGDRSEIITDVAIDFFDDCQVENLLEDSDDYEMILSFLAVGLKKVGSNQDSNNIFVYAIRLIHGACDSISDKKIIEKSGVMEPLVVLLASNDMNEDKKTVVRKVIRKITAA